jgi:hypothetical protein
LYRKDVPNELYKEGPLSFVTFESPFISVSTVSRVHPSLVSLGKVTVIVVLAVGKTMAWAHLNIRKTRAFFFIIIPCPLPFLALYTAGFYSRF